MCLCQLFRKQLAKEQIFEYTNVEKHRNIRKNNNNVLKKTGQLYRRISSNCFIIMDDEKYFSLSNVDIPGNSYYYSSDKSTTPPSVKYKNKVKYEPKILVCLAISSKGISEPYIHRSKNAIDGEVYLNQCIKSKLIPFIDKHHSNDEILFWPDLAKAHYSKDVLNFLASEFIPIVPKDSNPPNVPQGRPIEDFWGVLAELVYEENWEAKG